MPLHIEPTLRPELTSVVADVTLPAYLGRPHGQWKDVRGGVVSLVEGSQASFTATASRSASSGVTSSAAVVAEMALPSASRST